MKLILILFCLLFLLNCSNKDNFLQQHEISLEQPRLKATNTIIDSSVFVSAELRMSGIDITYTTDGSEPKASSKKYNTDLKLNKAGVYKFKAFHENYMSSDISEIKLYRKGFIPYEINWQTEANNNYSGKGKTTVLNNQKGTLNFRDEQWFGFDTIAQAEVHFKNKIFIKSLTIGYLVDTKSWIFPPESVSLIYNKTDTLKVKISKVNTSERLLLDDVFIPINREIKSITVKVNNTKQIPDWHPGKRLKAWLFMDEWIFN